MRKGNLIAELILQAKADVLVEPRFTFEQGQAGRNSRKLTVTGYPATFKNFRSATPADFELLKSAELSQDIQLTTRYKMKDLKRGITLPKPKTWLPKNNITTLNNTPRNVSNIPGGYLVKELFLYFFL